VSGFTFANAEKNLDANEIMSQVIDRYQGESKVSQLSLITCEYRIVNQRVKCESQRRKKVLRSFVKNYGESLRDTKGYTHIDEPVSERGISILQYDYEDTSKDTDQWLYLPELNKVKRISSDGSAPKSASLFGSEFSLEDIERPKLSDYKFSLLEQKTISGENYAIIQQVPVDSKAKSTSYSKQLLWVDLNKHIVRKTEYYAWDQKLIKVRQSAAIEDIDGIWTVGKEVIRNLETQRISELSHKNVVYNVKIDDNMLTQRMLVDPIFRESKLKGVTGSLAVSN